MQVELIEIGYLSRPHGFKGEIKCTLESLLLKEKVTEFIWVFIDGKPVPFFVSDFYSKKQDFIIKLEDIDDEQMALKFKNTSIFCETKYYDSFFEKAESLDDYIGFKVEDIKKGIIGEITSIIENTIQPTLVLTFNKKEILIPYTKDIIIETDEKNRIIKISAPEGLIELYLD